MTAAGLKPLRRAGMTAVLASLWLLCGAAAAQQPADAAPAAAKTLSELVEAARRGSARQRDGSAQRLDVLILTPS